MRAVDMILENIVGNFAKFKTLLVNGSKAATLGDDQTFRGVNGFDTRVSGSFAIANDDPLDPAFDPSYAMVVLPGQEVAPGVDGGQLLMSFDDIQWGQLFCGGHSQIIQDDGRTDILREDGNNIRIDADAGDILLNPFNGGGVATSGGVELECAEEVTTANGTASIKYNSQGEVTGVVESYEAQGLPGPALELFYPFDMTDFKVSIAATTTLDGPAAGFPVISKASATPELSFLFLALDPATLLAVEGLCEFTVTATRKVTP